MKYTYTFLLLFFATTFFAQETFQPRKAFPIQNAKPKKGIYRTAYDFIENTPDTLLDFKYEHFRLFKSKNFIKSKLKITASDIKPWGFCDSLNYFIRGDKGFYYPLQLIDSQYVTFGKTNEINSDWLLPSDMIYSKDELPFRLNLQNRMMEYYKTDKEIGKDTINSLSIFNSTFSLDKNLTIFINETQLTNLPQGAYAIIEMKKIPQNAKICVQLEGEPKVCENLTLIEGKRSYYLAKIKKNNTVTLEVQTDKTDIKNLKAGAANGTYEPKCVCFYKE